jgi:hypothetical protein
MLKQGHNQLTTAHALRERCEPQGLAVLLLLLNCAHVMLVYVCLRVGSIRGGDLDKRCCAICAQCCGYN